MANIRKPLTARNDSNAIATIPESGCIKRTDDSCAVD
jgi:hypothetical protein